MSSGIQSVPPDMAADMARTTAIVAAVDELLGDAGRLLDEHLAGIDSRNTVALVTVSLGVVASVALIGLVFGMMRRDLHRSERLAATHSDALRESELRFRRVFEESPLGILLAEQRRPAHRAGQPGILPHARLPMQSRSSDGPSPSWCMSTTGNC